jgi:hypothetical protein
MVNMLKHIPVTSVQNSTTNFRALSAHSANSGLFQGLPIVGSKFYASQLRLNGISDHAFSDLRTKIEVEDFLGPEYPKEKYPLSPKERKVLEAIYFGIPTEGRIHNIKEILKGAHVILRDDAGRLYQQLTSPFANLGAYERNSSHSSKDQQYGIVLDATLRTILTGTTIFGDTWFQFEGSAWGKGASFGDRLEHAVDYVKYKISGKNQGPLGVSSHVETKPLIIECAPV